MIGLEKVTDRIISEARGEADKLMEAANAKIQSINAATDAKIAAMREEKNLEIRTESENIVSRARSASDTQNRNIILDVKFKSLDETFAACEEAIIKGPKEDYIEFILLHTKAAIESAPADCSCVLSFNADDAKNLAPIVLEGLGMLHPGRKFSVSDKTAKINGGVLLDFGETDVDCSVKAVLSEYRPMLEAPLCQLLFESTKTK